MTPVSERVQTMTLLGWKQKNSKWEGSPTEGPGDLGQKVPEGKFKPRESLVSNLT